MKNNDNPEQWPPLKAMAPTYHPLPFYFQQEYSGGTRIIAWTGIPAQVQSLFFAVLRLLGESVDVLLKVEAEDGDPDKDWTRYHLTEITRDKIEQAIQLHSEFVFRDGTHQLCLRNAVTADYFALDEHGIFFLYFPLTTMGSLLEHLGFEARYEEPLFGSDHYHYSAANANEQLRSFVKELGLEFIAPTQDSQEPGPEN
jgi:hypothetical protein